MRSTRVAALFAFAAVLSWGCTPAQNDAFRTELAREAWVPSLGPAHVVSVVGAAAPGGSSGMHAVGMDLAWRSLAARHFELPALGPSPFDVPDPNRPVQFRKRGDVTEIIIQ